MNAKSVTSRNPKKGFRKQFLAIFLCLAMIVTMAPVVPDLHARGYAADAFPGGTVTPVLAVTGQGLLDGGAYSLANVGYERGYTLAELKAVEEKEQLFSAINTNPTKSQFLGKGITLETLLGASGVEAGELADKQIDVMAKDGYTVRFDPLKTGDSATTGKPLKTPALSVERYYYPNLSTDSAAGATEAKALLAWERGGERGFPETVPTTTGALLADETPLLLMVGQQHVGEQNNPLYNKSIQTLLVGDKVTETAITIDGTAKTRAQILLMARGERSYTYATSGDDKTEYTRGVPLSILLSSYGANDVVHFASADGYAVAADGKTVGELVSGNYLLAYEKGSSAATLKDIYDVNSGDATKYGFFRLYGDGAKPSQMVNSISVTPASGINFAASPYKHINNGGLAGSAPYNIDAITGATLTVEGPGVTSSVPLPIRDLEGQNTGAFRGTYTDSQSGTDVTLQYEGIKLSYILKNMTNGTNGIHLTNKANRVIIKNRVRQTVAEFTLAQMEAADAAGKPILIAYGAGKTDDSLAAPFVFNGAAGSYGDLANEDGPIKLVYDKTAFAADPNPGYSKFSNLAYIYVAETTEPGFKHNSAPYDTPENAEYVLTVTGDKIGREVNYTVKELENMVPYTSDGAIVSGSMGYRDEYSLSNTTYWYVNQYEGVQLSKLLLQSGLSPDAPSGVDKNTLVSFSATDNYKDFDKFTLAQVFDPAAFGFYEKNPADANDGKYAAVPEDLKKTGYPVLVAYGINSYPFVIKNTLSGYMSGLSNDGGPLRIISGKTEYGHANGSKQAKLLDKIIVGNDLYYSTHKYNPNKGGAYQALATASALNVKVVSGNTSGGAVLLNQNYTLGELEDYIYGGKLTKSQLKEAKVKAFYENTKSGNFYSDLYEGINLTYFLENIVELPGHKGTVTFSNGTQELKMGLEEVLSYAGYNGTTKLGGLSPLLAYAKNGTPLVKDKASAGYEGSVSLATGTAYEKTITVKNSGGPLAVLFSRNAAEATEAKSLDSVTSITINLSPDNYAHTEAPYSSLATQTLTVSGEGTRLTTAAAFTVADLERKQTLAVTGDYNVRSSTGDQTETRYRGISLYDFLGSTSVGLKPNADKVIVTCQDGKSYEFSLAEVYKADYVNGEKPAINNLKMILAYGSAPAGGADLEDGKPLVTATTDSGYDTAYANSGGPLCLVVGQTATDEVNSEKVLENVVSIEVTASAMVSWNHSSSPVYQTYLNDTLQLQVVDAANATVFEKTYKLSELEAMASLVERENITWVGTQQWEGINLWDFVLQEAATVPGIIDPGTVTVFAADGAKKELRSIFGMDALENGIKDGDVRIPIILGYAVNGYPLVAQNTSGGYDALAQNGSGPLRLMTHGNQGACLSDMAQIVVKVGTTAPPPGPVVLTPPLTIKGWGNSDITYAIGGTGGLKNITNGSGAKLSTSATYTYTKDGLITDAAIGVKLIDLLTHAGISGSRVRVTINTTDGYKDKAGSYDNITLADIEAKNYFVAYDCNATKIADVDKNNVQASLRIYRNFDDGSTWKNRVTNVSGLTISMPFDTYPGDGAAGNLPVAGIRSISADGSGGLWVSTYGGGVAYKSAAASTFTVYNQSSAIPLPTGFVSAVAADKNGGVWMTQNASYTNPGDNRGVVYLKDGKLTSFRAGDNPKTIPNDYVQEIQIDKDGNVWFGSFGGLTKYDVTAKTWRTWTQADGFPAASVDNLIFDNKGGVWCGFYPTGAGTEEDPFVGGFAHMDSAGKITKYQFTADYNVAGATSLLAQVWVRDIAVDPNGGAWVVASGSTPGLANVGGTVWYVDAAGNATKYTGDALLGEGKLTGDSEIRMVTVDPDGGLWFGTSADGLFYVKDPVNAAPLTITGQYNGTNGALPTSTAWNNIYSLDFVGKTLYAGSSAGLAYRPFDFAGTGTSPTKPEEVPAEYDLMISGAGVNKTAYFTLAQLKNALGAVKLSKTYSWLNSYKTTGSSTFEGIYLENLLEDVVGLNAKAKSITVTASDKYYRTFNLDSNPLGVNWTDPSGNKLMLAWKENGKAVDLVLVIGQKDSEHINKPMWISDVVSITVEAVSTKSGTGTTGQYEGKVEEKPAETQEKEIVKEIKSEIKTEATVKDGTASATLDSANTKKALESIKAGAPTDGSKAKGMLEIDAKSKDKESVKTAEVKLPKASVDAVAGEKNVSTTIKTDLGDIVIDPDVMAALSGAIGSDVTISITKTDPADLDEATRKAIGDRPVLDITVTVDGKKMSTFGGSHIRSDVPYTPKEGEKGSMLLMFYLDGKDAGKPVKLSLFKDSSDSLTMKVPHLSLYGVGYNNVTFSDISSHWAKNSIEFLAAREILKGKSASTFDPEGKVTRAEYVTMLANSIDGIEPAKAAAAGFEDISSSAWYAAYVNWAVSESIVKGYADGTFRPEEKITREQMAAMTESFLKAMELDVDVVNKKIEFKDQNKISSWSAGAVTSMQQRGIINGNPDGSFAPQGTATRAQAAAILKAYMEALLK